MMRQLRDIYVKGFNFLLGSIALLAITAQSISAQCSSVPTEISGNIFIDQNLNGQQDDTDGASGVLVYAFDSNGSLADQAISDLLGQYTLEGLTAGESYRIEFRIMPGLIEGPIGVDNKSSVRNADAGTCDVHYGIVNQDVYYGDDSELAITCYVQGDESENSNVATIVSFDHNFNSSSSGRFEEDKASTGSVWGLAYNSQDDILYSAAFVKQMSTLKSDPSTGAPMHDAIYQTDLNSGTTSLFTRLSQLGIPMANLVYTDAEHCDYGDQVGREGLGGMEISDDEKTLYVVNISGNSVVAIDVDNPTAASTQVLTSINTVLPTPAVDEEMYPFALKYYKNKLYVGYTLVKQVFDGINANSSIHIVEYDIATEASTLMFSTNYNKGSWTDNVLINFVLKIQHWLTDIDFINDDEMIISLNDRKGNRYCEPDILFPDQKGDVLIVFKDASGAWTLENGGVANGRTGRSTTNGQGPGGGEFFGDDFFPEDDEYHNEVSLGSIHVIPGKNEVVSAVFDPLLDVYSGGLHRYSTVDGSIQGAVELYTDEYVINLGKATGFGGMALLEERPELEIGNLVWLDDNKNGKQDAGENGVAGVVIDLYNEACEVIGTTTTDDLGYYVFNNTNVDENNDGTFDRVSPYTKYYVALSSTQFNTTTSSISVGGDNYLLTAAHDGYSSFPDASDSDAVISTSCAALNGLAVVELTTEELGNNNHTFDIGLVTPGNFDLALRKELISSNFAVAGDQATFKITVFNQGEVGARTTVIKDYIPAGLEFNMSPNSDWVAAAGYATYTIDAIAPGTQEEIFIHFIIKPGFSYEDFINYAEIQSSNDQFNQPADDVDSSMDGENDDIGGEPFQITDDEVNDDGDIDEDDHDPAALNVFDLALTKKIVNAKSGYVKGEVVQFEFNVYNQGNVVATAIEITDYLPAGLLIVSPSQWSEETGNYNITIPSIDPGQRETVYLDAIIDTESTSIDIVNIAEISEARLENGELATDYDSTADIYIDNDKGGDPYDSTDNEINDNGELDEDDHDPAILSIDRFDLALIKRTELQFAQRGDLVPFEITITNQGTITADEITIIDYLPEFLNYETTTGWEIDADSNMPMVTLSRANGMLPNTGLVAGEEITFTILTRLSETAPIGQIVNEAEIVSSKDFNGEDRTNDDFDSTPDMLNLNDAGGEIGTLTDDFKLGTGLDDEDDHDPAPISVLNVMPPAAPYCLSNATNDIDGQFVYVLEFEQASGEQFVVTSATGIEAGLNQVGDEPNIDDYTIGDVVVTAPFGNGFLYETPNGDGTSVYSLEGVGFTGVAVTVLVEPAAGGASITLTSEAGVYNTQIISGPAGVCAGSTTTYSVEETVGTGYEWDLAAGGTIIGATDEATVTVEWDAAPGGPFALGLTQTSADLCVAPSILEVSSGESAGVMACIGSANLSLNFECEMEITPELVLSSDYSDTNIFAVTVMDEAGNALAEPVLTSDHIGQEMTVKVMDVCTGNSCWTSLTVEDKIDPVFVVEAPLVMDCNMATSFPDPIAEDNCSGDVTLNMISENFTQLSCDPDYTTTIERVFTATDAQGNVSEPYTQVINLARLDVNAVVFPANRTVADDNPLFCQQFGLDDEGNPSPEDAGVPFYNGSPIYPYTDQFCSVGVDYTDQIITPNGCVQKIMRTWTVFEWYCSTSNIATVIQEINIADQLAPQFVKPADFTISTNLNECVGTATLPAVSPVDDCSEMFEVDIQYPDGFLNNQNGGVVDLELGENLITYTVYDGCLNSTEQSFLITVEDNTVPVMVCEGNTVISLQDNGTAYAPASVFDDGSVTDCSPLTFEVKRMDNGSACNISNFAFGEYVEFCCEDVGQEVMVLLRATDESGNSNTCMVTTVIQDKNPPVLTVPADVTIQCTDTYDLTDLASQFGEAIATDNCMNSPVTETYVADISACSVGTITRNFVASDGNGEAYGSQVITIENEFAFDLSNITWPLDYTTDDGCNAGDLQPEDIPAPFNEPVITFDACDMISMDHTDQTFTTSDDACFKIIRKWTVLDHCQLDADGLPLAFEYDQTIVVTNSVAPTITTSCEPVSVDILDSCIEGEITLGAMATDDCTEEANLVNSYFIDLDNDGSFDLQEASTGGSISITEVLPVGNHRIVYNFEDRCGNDVTCTQFFSIISIMPPTAYCQDLAIELTPMDTDGDNVVDAEMAFLDVDLIGGGSESACDFPITLSYDIEGDSTIATFDCFNLGLNIVTVYVTDIFGNQSSCEASVFVQDNNDVDICPSVEDCIIPPPATLEVVDCVNDLDPATIGGSVIVETPCVCEDFDISFSDVDISNPADACVEIERTYTVTFNCFISPMEFSYTQIITQLNAAAPIITACPPDGVGMATTMACTDFVSLGVPTFDGSCNSGIVVTNDSPFADNNTGDASGNYPVGTTSVVYTVTDLCGNASTCSITVTVDDLGAPNCVTQDITVTIPADGSTVFIVGEDIDGGSTDDCGMIVDFDATPSSFDCDDLGDNVVELLVTDQSGNTSVCTATVTVEDDVAPICMTQNLEFTITDANQTITIIGEDLDNGSFDVCGMIVDYDATPNTFTCADAGVNNVTLTVTDDSGNTSVCSATVTILDGVAPTCVTQDITVTLDAATNTYALSPLEINNGSADICGNNITLSATPNIFDCDDLGDNTVTLTVTDDAGNSSECTAMVTVLDTVPPTAICAAPGMVTLTIFSATFPVPISPTFIDDGSFDECGEIATIIVDPPSATCADIGELPVVLTVTDTNGNVGTCETTVIVQDAIAPVAVCVSDITVTIGMSGEVVVDPISIDNGSTDACGMIVDYSLSQDTFDCDDLGDNVVVLTVTDDSGNTDTCETTITVESNDVLEAVCQDITVFLGDGVINPVGVTITAADVDGGSMLPCGNSGTITIDEDSFNCNNLGTNPNEVQLIVTDDMTGLADTCIALVTVVDTIPPTVVCPPDLTFTCEDDLSNPFVFGEPIFNDNCLGSTMQDTTIVEALNDCGLGTITITYLVTDLSGNTAECTQNITIEVTGDNLFNESNIVWPVDTIEIVDCTSLDPADLMSFPEIDTMNAICFDLTIDFNDVSVGMGSACQDTIIRTWTITDVCQTASVFTFDQTLFINDTIAPAFSGLPMDTIAECNAFLDLSALTVMDCTVGLVITNDSPVAPNNQLDASGVYPPGVTIVNYTATDSCGNVGMFSIEISVEDMQGPTFNCIKVFPEIQENDQVTVAALDHIESASDNCSDSSDLVFMFVLDFEEDDPDLSDNILVDEIVFDCDDVGVFQVFFIVAIDEAGNYTPCGAQTTVTDPNNFCSMAPNGIVQGNVETYYGAAIQSTALYADGDVDDMEMVENDGFYVFDEVSEGDDVNLTPYNNEEPAAGITTLDILLIQKHILGLQTLPTAYDIIAADADNNEVVNGIDIIQIQKIILGTYEEFPTNNSFRFIDASFGFVDPANPFASTFPENAILNDIEGLVTQDFVGVKVGDVNGTFQGLENVNGEDGPQSESLDLGLRSVHNLYVDDALLNPINGYVSIPVYSEEFEQLQALEMTIDAFDGEIARVEPGAINIGSNDYNANGEALKISWLSNEAVELSEGEILFTIVVKSDEAINAQALISMNDDINEFYTSNADIASLRFIQRDDALQAVLYQNVPNPWTDNTFIDFEMVIDADYTFNFYDVDGRLLTSKSGFAPKGHNTIEVRKDEMTVNSGMIIYEFISGNRKLTKRMMLME